MQPDFSFIILTFNEAVHLPRLLNSINRLQAETFVLDSGSTDGTLKVCETYQVKNAVHTFENHPKQWQKALTIFPIRTPWVIGLDADQIVSPELYEKLKNFRNKDHPAINGIYFNRKYIFKGKWIKNGGYYPKYLLKMFRYNLGYSDLTEQMDHRFIVPGKIMVWKDGYIVEENLKENKISFWLSKHNRYSDLLAKEAVEKMLNPDIKSITPNFWGPPNEHNAWLKQLWQKTPKYLRPFLYLGYRMFIQKGILDGKTGIIYHFLQSFWFRLIVDIKIEERLRELKIPPERSKKRNFIFLFPSVSLLFYLINLTMIGITSPGGLYSACIDQHFNYIRCWRNTDLYISKTIIESLGHQVSTNGFHLHVYGKAGFRIVYSCLGYGILSVFYGFVCCYPKPLKMKLVFLFYVTCLFQVLNLCRFVLLALFWKPGISADLHLIFNLTIYCSMTCTIYFCIRKKQ